MPHFANDDLFDAALNVLKDNCTKMVLTAGAPTSFATANGAQKLAEVTMVPADFVLANGDTSGRKVTCAAKNGIAVSAAGDGDHVAYLDVAGSRILHYYQIAAVRAGLLVADQVNFPVHDLEIRDVVAE
jgi:hypothetical protein